MYNQKSRPLVTSGILLTMMLSIGDAQTITGSGTTDYVPKFTGTSTIGNSVLYESSGKIGIGTTTPGSALTVNGAVAALGTTPEDIRLLMHTGHYGCIRTLTTNAGKLPLYFQQQDSSGTTIPVGIDAAGRMGIGTASPQNKLHVSNTGNNVALFESTTPGAVLLLKDSNTTASEAIARIGDDLDLRTNLMARLTVKGGTGYVGIGTSAPSEKLAVDGNIRVERSVADVSIGMKDSTTSAADPVAIRRTGDNLRLFTNGAERLTIASDGNVTIGTTNNPLGWKLLVGGGTAITGNFVVEGSPS
jgi:ethanolamine utilization microcompartment shell protein EutS